jgi:hypothetical protein
MPDQATLPAVPKDAPAPLSFSRLSVYAGCPRRYQLRYVEHAPRRENGAGLAGRAIHQVIEEAEADAAWADEDAWEFGGPWAERFLGLLWAEVEEAGGPEACYWGGRRSKQFPDGETPEWWEARGPIMLWRYAQVRRTDEEEGLVVPAGGVELEVAVNLGEVHVRGRIDAAVLVDSNDPDLDAVTIRDYKSGTMLEPLQLVVYAWLVRIAKGWTAARGQFVKLRPDKPTERIMEIDLEPLIDLAPERMRALAAQLVISQERDLWPINPSSLCVACDVKEHCPWGQHVERRS